MQHNSTIKYSTPTAGRFSGWLGQLWLRLSGWRIVGQAPAIDKYVLIGAPHTSNWDFPFMLAVAAALGVRVSWMGKDSLFKGPFGVVMRWLGGIPIDRSRSNGVVAQVAERFQAANQLVVLIPPSGTRKKREYWKSGFYWIAHMAQVPVVCAYLDFERKEAGIGLSFTPTGNVSADMDQVREFYKGIQGKYRALMTPIRLREETAEDPS